MNKKLAAALSSGAVLVVALSGCSSKKDSGPDPKLVAWAKTVCDAVPAQDSKIRAANASIAKIATDSNLPPKTAKETYAQAFQDMAGGYKAIASAISSAGAPPGVSDGSKRQQDAAKNLNGLSASYAALKKKVDALDTKDQGKFAKGLHDVADQTKEIGQQSNSGTEALKRLEQGDVKAAIAKQPSCQVAASASASSTAG
ncbi:ribosomal protein L18 [Streptomyces griseochromogenes]|uniref:Ribosomal protein L18 n=1 Tax=Streptomyces griseochromogenes TaxID=68214 RepID=A0A1B1BBT5_9ACTN|nr:small secreted protein [Streptomyces griseochromogenes]ANP56251.1 small secreted protein [Streptomyces griseochromogenes]MBP2054482.1 ribosomal protein L18 [Streptomyces griseochromogenes]